jgi:long-chain acyl-CoA synthetase
VFRGYHRNAAATAEAVDAEGWLHTGDAGYLDARGHLVVIDRTKDVLIAADGTPLSSAFIENKLSPPLTLRRRSPSPTRHPVVGPRR